MELGILEIQVTPEPLEILAVLEGLETVVAVVAVGAAGFGFLLLILLILTPKINPPLRLILLVMGAAVVAVLAVGKPRRPQGPRLMGAVIQGLVLLEALVIRVLPGPLVIPALPEAQVLLVIQEPHLLQ